MFRETFLCCSSFCLGCLVTIFYVRSINKKNRKRPDSEVIFFPQDNNVVISGKAPREQISSGLNKLISYIKSAKNTIDICVFILTSEELSNAIVSRINKGVKVCVILDDGNVAIQGSQVNLLRSQGAFLRSRSDAYLMHHKFAIIDDRLVLSGSLNWTSQALQGNYENVIVTNDAKIVKSFEEEFRRLWTKMTT